MYSEPVNEFLRRGRNDNFDDHSEDFLVSLS